MSDGNVEEVELKNNEPLCSASEVKPLEMQNPSLDDNEHAGEVDDGSTPDTQEEEVVAVDASKDTALSDENAEEGDVEKNESLCSGNEDKP